MTNIIILGATGRTGGYVLQQLAEYEHLHLTAALKKKEDIARLPQTKYSVQTAIIDINNVSNLKNVTKNADIIVNAIRMRGDIPENTLVELDKKLRSCLFNAPTLIVTVGGAGSLNMGDGTHFWEDSDFPSQTLPRGRAHAKLRYYLEKLPSQDSWTYLIPPPAYIPDGKHTGTYQFVMPSTNETNFLNNEISYKDFATAVCEAVFNRLTGVHLVGNKKNSTDKDNFSN